MRNIKLIIEYDGTNYAGWQIQNRPQSIVYSPQKKSIQETIEKTLQRILQEKIKVTASGRTDSGVHALAQTANFKTTSSLALKKIQKALNSLLPADISIKEAWEADKDFHSRYRAKSKIYRYFILNGETKSAFLHKHAWHIPYQLDVRLMRKESKALAGRHDFKSFCASGSSVKTTVRTIKKISVKEALSPQLSAGQKAVVGLPIAQTALSSPAIIIEIEANGFLYNMVRNIVGTLVEIGRGRLKEKDLDRILLARNRKQAGPTAPARGLFLAKVKY